MREQNRFEGGDLVVQALAQLGVRRVFSVSGGPLNSLYHAAAAHGLGLVHTRHEAAAAFMAEGVARVSGTPGVAAVTLGPGVTNTVTAALVSKMAGTPLLILGAQANTAAFDRGAGMSADHIPIMAPVTKWAARVLHTERIPEYLESAWRIMWAGRPGPVFLEMPVNVLAGPAGPAPAVEFLRQRPGLEETARDALSSALAGARRPVVVLGDDVHWDRPAGLTAAIEHLGWPFVTARLARGAVDERHPLWAGVGYVPANATLKRALAEADLVVVLGHHFEFDLGFGDGVAAHTVVVQTSVDAELLGKNRRADVKVLATPSSVIEFLRSAQTGPADGAWIESVLSGWREERERQLDACGGDEPAASGRGGRRGSRSHAGGDDLRQLARQRGLLGRMRACGCRPLAGTCGRARPALWAPRSLTGWARSSPNRTARWSCSWATGAPATISASWIPPPATHARWWSSYSTTRSGVPSRCPSETRMVASSRWICRGATGR